MLFTRALRDLFLYVGNSFPLVFGALVAAPGGYLPNLHMVSAEEKQPRSFPKHWSLSHSEAKGPCIHLVSSISVLLRFFFFVIYQLVVLDPYCK